MDLPKDPIILLSFINTKLRDFYPSLDALCDDMQADGEEIKKQLALVGFKYDEKLNQFI